MMEEKGYLLIVLNTHMPFVHSPEVGYSSEETWLFEAMTECYIPLIRVFQKLYADGIDFRITQSLTPCLLSMLANIEVQDRYLQYLDDHIRLAVAETTRLQAQPRLRRLAYAYVEHYTQLREYFVQHWRKNLLAAFKALNDSGKVALLTSGATHAYFPLWELYPQMVDVQIRIGVQQYRQAFDRDPLGFWLPECAFYPGVDRLLRKSGLRYFFLDSHGLLNGHPRPKYGVYAPIHCPSDVAAFGRDWESHDLVWLKDKGYPGDAHYLDHDRDIGYELPEDYLFPFTHCEHRIPTGIKYHRLGAVWGSDVYEPEAAIARCDAHADHFVHRCQEQVERLYQQLGKKPVIVALFDTEHFGHWWHEGPTWLDLAIRKLACDQHTVKLVTGADYLTMYPTNQVVMPSMSSWGYQGYNETWLMGRNHWIYPQLYAAVEDFEHLLSLFPSPQADIRLALNQYLRELLLAQSSDWAFILHQETAQNYAAGRVKAHIENMTKIYQQVRQQTPDKQWLIALQKETPLFSEMDLLTYYRQFESVND